MFVTELQPDTLNIQPLKFGMPVEVLIPTIDVAHTVHYATGYVFQQVQPASPWRRTWLTTRKWFLKW